MSHERVQQLLHEASEILAVPVPSQRIATRLTLGPGKEDQKATSSLQKAKLYARSNGSLNDSVLSAGFYAKKVGKTFFGYSGNSYMHAVWRVTDKASEYLDPINNTGGRVYSVTPELVVSWHEVSRPSAKQSSGTERQAAPWETQTDNSFGRGFHPLPPLLRTLGRYSDGLAVSKILDHKVWVEEGVHMITIKVGPGFSIMRLDMQSLLKLGLGRMMSNDPGQLSFYFQEK